MGESSSLSIQRILRLIRPQRSSCRQRGVIILIKLANIDPSCAHRITYCGLRPRPRAAQVHCLLEPEAHSPASRCWWARAPSDGSRDVPLASSEVLVAGQPSVGSSAGSSSHRPHEAFSVSVLPSRKDTGPVGQGSPQGPRRTWSASPESPFQMRPRVRVSTSACPRGGGISRLHTVTSPFPGNSSGICACPVASGCLP